MGNTSSIGRMENLATRKDKILNIVNAGSKYVVYDESVNTFRELPPKTYKCCFDKLSGFSLVAHDDLKANEKMYGVYAEKAVKVLNTFCAMDRNMGVILSGIKGSGKSMFARLLAKKGAKIGLPLIIVDFAVEGLDDFLSSIKQECIVLFDEFEKTFSDDDDDGRKSEQDMLLSLFDGVDDGKKLYIITCNDTNKLSDCLLGRPGRFHYHFKMVAPTKAEIAEYMNDNLKDDVKFNIDSIVKIGSTFDLTYDMMRAIAFELNHGYTLKESMADLNISFDDYMMFNIVIEMEDGMTIVSNKPIGLYIDDGTVGSDYIQIDYKNSVIPKYIKENVNEIMIRYIPSLLKVGDGYMYYDSDDIDVNFTYEHGTPDDLKEALEQIKVKDVKLYRFFSRSVSIF